MYNRLITLLEEAHEKWLHYVDTCAFNQTALSITFEKMFADHLLANNVIVPPCEVGSKVYAKVCYLNEIHQFQITNITITQNKKGEWTRKYRAMRVVNGKTIDSQINFDFKDIGKTVFFTKEEAETKLRGE